MAGALGALLAVLALGAPGEAARSANRHPGPPKSQPPHTQKKVRRSDYDASTVLVRVRNEGDKRALGELGLTFVRDVPHTAYALYATRNPGRSLARARADGRVADAQPNYIRSAFAEPNDRLYVKGGERWYARQLRLPNAWGVQTGSRSLTLAVVDTGVDAAHPELAGRVAPGRDVVNNDSDPSDDNGHGTMVAGIAAAAGNNALGIAGVAWDATILPVKVLNAQGSGTDADVATGITWAADQGASVINLSLGGPSPSPVLADAVDYARSKGVVVVCAAGNAGWEQPMYPAAYANAVAVTATNWSDDVAWFSNWGTWVDLAAPGMDITGPRPGGVYATGSGTSFAAPIVSGTALLVRSQNPSWTADEVVSRLESTARDAGPRGVDSVYGYGIVDPYAALGGAPQPPVGQAAGDQYEPNDAPGRAPVFTADAYGHYPAINARISTEGESDWFAIDVPGPGFVGVTVTPPDYNGGDPAYLMDPVVELYTPNLELLQRADDYSGSNEEEVRRYVTSAGRYYFRVANVAPSRTTGSYTAQPDYSAQPLPRFQLADTTYLPGWPKSSKVADVTGDGKADVVMTTTRYDNEPPYDWKLWVWKQTPDGWLSLSQLLPTDASTTNAGLMNLAVGDLDGDGKTDVALTTAGGVDVYYQRDGTLAGPTLVATPAAAYQVRIADVNGDGRADMVVSTSSGAVLLLANTGSAWTTSTVTSTYVQALGVADVNGDGRIDVVGVTNDPSATLHVWAQQLDGSFGPARDYPATLDYWPNADGLATGDYNGDGRKDVAITIGGNSPGALLDVFYQQADGTLGTPLVIHTYDIPEPLETADVNGDGRDDLVTAHGGWYAYGYFIQQTDGTLGSEQVADLPYGPSEYAVDSIGVGDVNGDGKADVTIADYADGLIVLRQLSTAWPTTPTWQVDSSPGDLAQGVSTGAALQVRFGRALDATSVLAATTLRDGTTGAIVAGSAGYDAGTRTVTFQPSSALASGSGYELRISGVRDSNGMTQPQDAVVRFTTAGAAADSTPPETTITLAPPSQTTSYNVHYQFISSEPDSTFECSFDGSAYWYPCHSPYYTSINQWPQHVTFAVRAIDAAGNTDPTPASLAYDIVGAPAPANDDYYTPQTIGGSSGTVSGTTLGATKQYGEPNIDSNPGGDSIWFKWIAPASGTATFDTSGSAIDTLLAVYDTQLPPVAIADNDDAPGRTTSRIQFDAVAGQEYRIRVDGFNNGFAPAEGNVTLTWAAAGGAIDTGPPTVHLTAPADGARVGSPVTISADATDDSSVARVEFRAGGTLIATVTQPPYTTSWNASAIPENTVVQIQATAYDTTGKSASDTRSVTVDATPPQTKIDSGTSGTTTATTASFTFSANEPATFRCRLQYPAGSNSGDWTACTSPLTYTGLHGGSYEFDVFATDTVGNVDTSPASQTWTIFNDMFAAATPLGNGGILTSGTNVGATKEPGEPNVAGNRGGKSVWWYWTAPTGVGTVTIDTQGSTFDTLLGVYTGTAVSALTNVAANDNYGSASWSRVQFTATAGTTYRIVVDGRNGRSGNITLAVGLG